ncbi:MAG: threonine aldolase family protein [Deltaproteobacteria bacterium]|nr:threonine aldolase family protein [Deltaproteobacteria bacterium]
MFHGIDLYSDVVTQPTPGMRKAIAEAEVGDEQRGEDPTTARLESMAAAVLGKEAATFLPSATMANEIALRLHIEPGDVIIAAANAHIFFAETGGPAVHAGALARPIETNDGTFTGQDVERRCTWPVGPHFPRTRLVSVENTTNMDGGIPWDMNRLADVVSVAKRNNLKLHLDGSRLMNAVVASGVSADAIARSFDTVTLCLSKGLGCPMGALLAHAVCDTDRIRRLKQLMGGALRQSGMVAAAGIYALTHHIDRLADDHSNARYLAELLSDISDIVLEKPPATNMLFFRLRDPQKEKTFAERCLSNGIRFCLVGTNRFRAVTHLNITRADIERAVVLVRKSLG